MRSAKGLLGILVLVHGLGAAYAAPPATFHDDRGPEIAYRADEDGDVWEFRVITRYGELRGRIDHGDALDRISLELAATGAAVRISYSPGCDVGAHSVHLSIPHRDEDAVFLSDDASGEITPVVTEGVDCTSLANDPLERARVEALARLLREIETGGSDLRQHAQIVSALMVPGELIGSIDGCGEFVDPFAAGCYYNSPDFGSCAACCEGWANLTGLVCGGSLIVFCKGPWCRFATLACGGLSSVVNAFCTVHNCSGKPGDPSCRPPRPPCPGQCMQFCGPGWSSACGDCPDGWVCCN